MYISDNASNDNTYMIIERYMKQYKNIFAVRQELNFGSDANAEFVLKMPKSLYRWLLSDSVYINDGTIENVMKYLVLHKYDMVICDNPDNRTQHKIIEVFDNPNVLLSELGWHLTWSSCAIYSQQIIENANFSKYRNSRFIHTGIIFDYFAYHPCNVVFNPHAIVSLIPIQKKNHWMNIAFEVFAKDWYLFVQSLPEVYLDRSKQKCIKDHGIKSGLFSIKALIYLRMINALNISILNTYRFYIPRTININIKYLYFIAIIPRGTLHIFYILSRFFTKALGRKRQGT